MGQATWEGDWRSHREENRQDRCRSHRRHLPLSVLGFLFGWFVQFLWNETLASMFDWPPITYWEAVGLFVLAKILLGFGQPGRAPKHKNKTTEERDHAMVRQWWRRRKGLPEDRESDVPTSEMFQAYWREAGKAAYEAYLARHKDKEGDSPPST